MTINEAQLVELCKKFLALIKLKIIHFLKNFIVPTYKH